jgi:hypothetical protein
MYASLQLGFGSHAGQGTRSSTELLRVSPGGEQLVSRETIRLEIQLPNRSTQRMSSFRN